MNNETVFHRWFLLRGVEMKRALVLEVQEQKVQLRCGYSCA